jgi:2-iminobutanoate/2-iminopropanoate deaminase
VSGDTARSGAGPRAERRQTADETGHGERKSGLAAADCDLSRVVKATIYLKDMNDFASVNEVYGSYFPSDPPARSTIEASRLPKDVSVEMDFIAVKQ